MFKKVLACILAGAMVLGMTSVASAAVTGDVSYNTPVVISSEDFESVNDFATFTVTGYGVEGTDEAYWNDWCVLGVIIESDGVTSYKAVGGPQVTWDVSISGENTNDVLAADIVKTDANVATVNVSGLGENWTITVKSMGWDNAPDCAYASVDASGIGTPVASATGSVAPIAVVSVVAVVSAAVVVASKKRA